ncbi:hypothetical protein V6N12_019155 [Hibiscus sabdariffa]|uniref:Uncharacterized protein n=1 Tax=Hibiscus sabdariffa TaxID=183260 RepID=A0ABR2ASY0_9ROSI
MNSFEGATKECCRNCSSIAKHGGYVRTYTSKLVSNAQYSSKVEKAATTEIELDNSEDEIQEPDKKEIASTDEEIDNFHIDSPILLDLNATEDVEEEEDYLHCQVCNRCYYICL